MRRVNDTLYEILDQHTKEWVTYEKVTTFADGTSMTDANCDGVIYRKLGAEYFKRVFGELLDVRIFGAKGDYSKTAKTGSDDLAAISKAATVAAAIGAVLHFPSVRRGLGYGVSGTVQIPAGVSVQMDAPLYYTGTAKNITLKVGTETGVASGVELNLWVEAVNNSNWDDLRKDGAESIYGQAQSIAIQLVNIINSTIHIRRAWGHTIGVQGLSTSSAFGFAWNQITLGKFRDNRIHFDLANITNGWQNANSVWAGDMGRHSGVNIGKGEIGVRITSLDDSYTSNSNVFNDLWIESRAAYVGATGEALPFLLHMTVGNRFNDTRLESTSPNRAALITGAKSRDNLFSFASLVGASSKIVSDAGVADKGSNSIRNAMQHLVFDSGVLPDTIGGYNLESSQVPRMHWNNRSNGLIYAFDPFTWGAQNPGAAFNKNYVEFWPSGLGVYIDTDIVKAFRLYPNTGTSAIGTRFSVACYDGVGNVLGGAGTNYVTIDEPSPFVWKTDFGGTYEYPFDSKGETKLSVHDDVKKIRLIVTKDIRQLQIYALGVDGYKANVYSGLKEAITHTNSGVDEPGFGLWYVGRRSYNTDITKNINFWVCNKEGYACGRTWKPNVTAYVKQQVYTPDGIVYQCQKQGTTGTAYPTHTTGVVVDGTAEWLYLGVKATFEAVPKNLPTGGGDSPDLSGYVQKPDTGALSVSGGAIAVPLAKDGVYYAASYPASISVDTTNNALGVGAVCKITANGTTAPTVAGATRHNSSANFNTANGTTNTLRVWCEYNASDVKTNFFIWTQQ